MEFTIKVNQTADMLPKIKVGEPQPVECKKCGFSGYQFSDFMKIHFTVFHDKNGQFLSNRYSDSQKVLNEGVTPYCPNCFAKLDFKLIRTDFA